jgi:hypothetical protein
VAETDHQEVERCLFGPEPVPYPGKDREFLSRLGPIDLAVQLKMPSLVDEVKQFSADIVRV